MNHDLEVAKKCEILRVPVGSTIHGLHLEGTDDRDEMGIFCEPAERALGLRGLEFAMYRDAEKRALDAGTWSRGDPERTPRSGPGDLDLSLFSLTKFARLAAHGNPTVLLAFFAKPIATSELGARLQNCHRTFASKRAIRRFSGYLRAQRERLVGTRGQKRIKRPELVERYGYDTKFAMHALRLGFQGVEYGTTGRLTLPMAEEARRQCMEVRLAKWSFHEVVRRVEEIEADLEHVLRTSSLPDVPNDDLISTIVADIYLRSWGES